MVEVKEIWKEQQNGCVVCRISMDVINIYIYIKHKYKQLYN